MSEATHAQAPKRSRSKVQVKFRLPKATHQALTAIAAARGESLTETINGAVSAYVERAKELGRDLLRLRELESDEAFRSVMDDLP